MGLVDGCRKHNMAIWTWKLWDNFDAGGDIASPIVWRSDDGRYLYKLNEFGWVMTPTLGYTVYIGGNETTTNFPGTKGEEAVWFAATSQHLWQRADPDGEEGDMQYVITQVRGYGTEHFWLWDNAAYPALGGYWDGDPWYVRGSGTVSVSGRYYGRGSNGGSDYHNPGQGTAVDVTRTLYGMERVATTALAAPSGEYKEFSYSEVVNGDGTVTGTKVYGTATETLGSLTFTDQFFNEYIRSPVLDANGKHTYGTIHYDNTASKWIIGTIGAADGWWEGSEPSVSTARLFTFKPGSSGAAQQNRTVTYAETRAGGTLGSINVFEVARSLSSS